MKHSILVVDDEKDIVDSLERQFRKTYRVLKTTSGHEALRLLQSDPVSLIISDQRMPEITGVQLFERAQLIQPDAIRILLTGYTDVSSVISAINAGQVYRYITKPWDPTDLDIVIQKAIETFELRGELREKNAQLSRAFEDLKSLDKAKSDFMILIGHELKTPLTSIRSFTDLLSEESIGEAPKKYVSRIDQGVVRLEEVVFDVLDIMNSELGKLSVVLETFSLTDLIFHLTEVLKIQTQVELPSKQFQVRADKKLISRVLLKLLHNAIKFSKPGIKVKTDIKIDGKFLKFQVENSGQKIPEMKIKRLIEPFRVDEDIMHHSKGMGLGLAVSQSLLKAIRSKLEIASDDSSTKVAFKLPAP